MANVYGIPASWYITLSAALFCIGLFCVMSRRSAVGILLGVELMLNAASINFVTFGAYLKQATVMGEVFTIFIITIAAAEAAIGLALIINIYRHYQHIDADKLTTLKN